MNAIDKIIFNALAMRHGVVLPDVGTLHVVRKTARFISKKHLNAPVNRVEFSSKNDSDFNSLIAFIATEADVDAQQARQMYDKWLAQARQNNLITIEGVGEIKHSTFISSPELEALLNPLYMSKSVAMKPVNTMRYGIWIGVISLLIVVVAAGLYYQNVSEKDEIRVSYQRPAAITTPAMTDTAAIAAKATDTTVAMVATPALTTTETAQKATTTTAASTTKAAANGATTVGTNRGDTIYHIVIGVYSTAENAERCVKQTKAKDPSLPVMKVPFSGSKIMVSVYSSQSAAIAEQQKSKLSSSLSPDLWIYKQVIK